MPLVLCLGEKEDCVHSLHSVGHSLCKLSKLVTIRVGPRGPCLGIDNQVAVFEQFALLAEDEIGHFTEPYHQKYLGGQFGH